MYGNAEAASFQFVWVLEVEGFRPWAQVSLKSDLLNYSHVQSPQPPNGGGMSLMNCYLILSYGNIDELVQEVNRKWLEGWRPQGGLAVMQTASGSIFLQVITREEEFVTLDLTPRQKALVENSSS